MTSAYRAIPYCSIFPFLTYCADTDTPKLIDNSINLSSTTQFAIIPIIPIGHRYGKEIIGHLPKLPMYVTYFYFILLKYLAMLKFLT